MCKGSSSKTSTSTATNAPDPQAYALYSNLLAQAQGVANQPYVPYGGELVAPVNAQQQTGIAGINAAQQYYPQALEMYRNTAQPITAEQIERYVNPNVSNVVRATQEQFANQNAQQQNALRGRAAAQGALGGNRLGVAEGVMAGQQQLAQAPVIAGLYSKAYDDAVRTALSQQQAGFQGAGGVLGATGAMQTGAGAQIGAGSLLQQTQQAQDTAQYNQWMQQKAYPFQTLQWLAGLGTGVGPQMGGTSTGTQTTPGPSGLSQVLGGATAGLGMLGASGAFGAAGWMAPMLAALARGGRVRQRAAGGGIAYPDAVVPESEDTLVEQQKQLLGGNRSVQMFPKGTPELALPEGLGRFENERGTFHYDPESRDADEIAALSAEGRENELLDLGPYSKEDIYQRIQQGERPLVAVERTPDGVEVRAAVGTRETLPEQISVMERTKSPGNSIVVEDLVGVLQSRLAGLGEGSPQRAAGGAVTGVAPGGAATAPYPYAGGVGYVPGVNLGLGRTIPTAAPARMPEEANSADARNMKELGALAGDIGKMFGSAPVAEGQNQGAGLSATYENPSMYARGGAVGLAEPSVLRSVYGVDSLSGVVGGFAEGGSVEDPLEGEPEVSGGFVSPSRRVSDSNDIARRVSEAARRHGVPENIALGLARQESRFDPTAESPKGALGVTQLMPATARELGVDPRDPDQNIEGGMRYLAQQHQRFGSWPLALAAYNAGPGRVEAVRAGRATLPTETQKYVPAVLGRDSPDALAALGYADDGAAEGQRAVGLAPAAPAQAKNTGIDWSEKGKLWPSLISAGFGMLASRSPYAGVAIGEGGLAGAQAYEALRNRENSRAVEQQRINLEARRLQQQADIASRPYTELTAAQRADMMKPVQVGFNAYGQPIYAARNPKTGAYDIIDASTGQRKEGEVPPGPSSSVSPGASPAAAGVRSAGLGTEDEPITGDVAIPVAARLTSGKLMSDPAAGDYREDVLEGISPAQARQVRAIARGLARPPSLERNNPYNRFLMEKVYEYSPDFDSTMFARRQQAAKEFATGVASRNLAATKTLAGHLEHLYNASKELGNSQFATFNKAQLALAREGLLGKTVQDRIKEYETNAKAVADEAAKVFAGQTSALADREEWAKTFSVSDPMNVQMAAIRRLVNLVDSRLDAMADAYNRGMSTRHTAQDLIEPKYKDIFDRMRKAGQESEKSKESAKEAARDTSKLKDPPLPSGVPAGARYSHVRNQWRDLDGVIYDATGKPVQ